MMNHTPYGHPAWIEIDLCQFKKNLHLIQQTIQPAKLCLPVKANAYGHGLLPMAQAAVAAGVDYLAVSCLQEGALLRRAGILIPILVLGAIHEEQIDALVSLQLEFTISSLYKAKLVAQKMQQMRSRCRVHLEIDTGFQRTGVTPETAIDVLKFISSHACFDIAGVYSHLATADMPAHPVAIEQIKLFQTFIDRYVRPLNPEILCHIANSGGVCHYKSSHLDMVRPGILALGYFPVPIASSLSGIRGFFSIKAKIAYFKVVPGQAGIGYGHTYTTDRASRIVTIPVGYGDGYKRALSNKGHILIRDRRYPIVGRVCMDQFMVNVGEDEALVGETVTLIGQDHHESINLNDIAMLCDTIPYEILCGFNRRLPRYYHEQDDAFWDSD